MERYPLHEEGLLGPCKAWVPARLTFDASFTYTDFTLNSGIDSLLLRPPA
ncbi:hypothetical protein CCACVL1_02972 [Corchorus capsularis]|uniref:Uncharacterized protein n=1 Tax=Corchorus capsularis TaxID=210143 RepID=A0A1R3K4E3_COCAP|nr:hypothetical protein CCACVL1_02972 [Corchorus capsularis]